MTNIAAVEMEYRHDRLGPLTVKGQKRVLISGLETKLTEVKSKKEELQLERESLIKRGRDLSEEDMKRLTRLCQIEKDLTATIAQQREMFNIPKTK